MSGSWADSASLAGGYRPGASWLHRLPAGPKVVGLVVAVTVVLLLDTPYAAAAGLLAALLVLGSTGLPWRALARPLRAVAVVVVLLAVVQAWLLGWQDALVGVSRVLACLALAWAVSATTPVTAMLDLLQRALQPLRVLGVRPERVAMTVALAIRSIPLVVAAAVQADEARRARGARLSVRALVVPTVVRSVRISEALGEALLARGYPPREPDEGSR